MTNIDVGIVRPGTSVHHVIANDLDAGGQNEGWSLTFRVPDLPAGTYHVYARDGGTEAKLFLGVTS